MCVCVCVYFFSFSSGFFFFLVFFLFKEGLVQWRFWYTGRDLLTGMYSFRIIRLPYC